MNDGYTFNQLLIRNGNGRMEDGLRVGQWVYDNPQSKDTIEWCIYTNDAVLTKNSIICDWKVEDCEGCLFWAQSADELESIVVLDSIIDGGLNSLDHYALIAMQQISNNTVDGVAFESGSWWKLHDTNGHHSYFSVCTGIRNKNTYIYYIYYWYRNNHIYDITYRHVAWNMERNHDIFFWEFIYNFKRNGVFVLDKDSLRINRVEEIPPR